MQRVRVVLPIAQIIIEVVASFRVDRRAAPWLWGTPGAADERGAVRKMEDLLGESIGRNAHDHCMF